VLAGGVQPITMPDVLQLYEKKTAKMAIQMCSVITDLVTKNDEKMSDLKFQMKISEEKIFTLGEQMKEKDKEVHGLKSHMHEKAHEVTVLQAELIDLKVQVNNKDKQIINLQVEVNRINSQIQKQSGFSVWKFGISGVFIVIIGYLLWRNSDKIKQLFKTTNVLQHQFYDLQNIAQNFYKKLNETDVHIGVVEQCVETIEKTTVLPIIEPRTDLLTQNFWEDMAEFQEKLNLHVNVNHMANPLNM